MNAINNRQNALVKNLMRKPLILHLITGLTTGGAEMMLYKLLATVDRTKFDSVVVSLINSDEDPGAIGRKIRDLDIPVYGLGMAGKKLTLQPLKKLITLLRKLQPDLIQGWMYHANLIAQLLQIFSPQPIPVIWNIRHSLYALDYEKRGTALTIKILALLSRLPTKIIYNSQTAATQHEQHGYQKGKTIVIPNGFNLKSFDRSPEFRLSLRAELGLLEGTILIGRIGRYHPMKDHLNFLRAAALLLENYPAVHFVMAGTEINHHNEMLIQEIQRLKLSNRVHMLDERQDLPRITAGLDISTSSSAFGEAFPNIIGEAMACAVPCVATDVGDSAAILGDTGFIVPTKDSQAMANAWTELINLGTEARQVMGQRARDKIEQSFAIEAIVARYESLYTEYLRR